MVDNSTRIILTAEDRASAVVGKVSQSLGGLAGSAAGFASALGVAIAPVGAIAAALYGLKTSLDLGGKLNDMAMQTGATVEQLSALRNVAELSGVSLDEAGVGLAKLSKNMLQAATGNKEAAGTFKALGVAITDSRGSLRDSGQVMQDVAKSIAGLASPTERVAAAQLAFGKSGAQLVPMLMDMATASEQVATWTTKDAAAADEFSDNLTKLRQSVRGVGESLVRDMLPALNDTLKSFTTAREAGLGFFQSLTGIGVRGLNETLAEAKANSKQHIDELRKEIETAQAAIETRRADGGDYFEDLTTKIAAATPKLAYYKKLYAEMVAETYKASYSNEGRGGGASFVAMLNQGEESAKKARTEVDKLAQVLDKIYGKDSGLDSSYWQDLNQLNAGYKSGRLDIEKYRDAVGKLTIQQKFWTDAQKAGEQIHKDNIDFYKSEEAALKALAQAQQSSTKEFGDLIDRLDSEAETLGLSSDERERYIALKKLDREYTAGLIESEDDYLARINAINDAFAKRKGVAEYQAGQQSMWTSLESVAHQTFVSIFDSGKDAFERLRDTLKNTVYELLYQMTVKQWIINIAGSMGASGSTLQALGAGSGGGLGGLLSGANSAYSLYTGGTTATIANGIGWLGNATGSTAVSAYGAGMGAAAGGADLTAAIAAYQEAAVAAAGTEAAAAYTAAAEGLAGGVGAASAIPYIGWIVAAIALIASVAGRGGGPKTEGDALFTLGGGSPTYAGSEGFFTGHSGDSYAQAVTGGVAIGIQETIKSLGGSAAGLGVLLGFNTDPQGDAPDNVTGAVRRADGSYAYLSTYDVDRGQYGAAMQIEAKRVLLAAINASEVSAAYHLIIQNVDLLTSSAEELDEVIANIGNAKAILDYGNADPFSDYAKSLAAAGNSYTLQLERQRESVLAAAKAFDGSTASVNALLQATQQRYEIELQLAQQVADSLKSTSDMFGDSARSVRLSVLDNQGKYGFYNDEVQKYSDILGTLSDPAAIAEYAKKLNDSIMSAWGVLEPDQQQGSADRFIALLDQADALAQSRYQAVETSAKTDREALSVAIATAIDEAMARAATSIAAAASVPQPVSVTVDVNSLFSELTWAAA